MRRDVGEMLNLINVLMEIFFAENLFNPVVSLRRKHFKKKNLLRCKLCKPLLEVVAAWTEKFFL